MKQSVQFPFEKTKRGKAGKPPTTQHLIRSENKIRGNNWASNKAARDKQRTIVLSMLSQLERPPLTLPDGRPNVIEVRVIRIEPGPGLDRDNCEAGAKAVVDSVARKRRKPTDPPAWLDLDDNDRRIRFDCYQQQCRSAPGAPRYHGVRIEIDSLDRPDVERHRVVGPAPPLLGAVAERNPPPPPKKMIKPSALAALRAQTHLLARPAFVAYPWEQVEGEGLAVDEYKPASNVPNPPEVIHAPIPEGWTPKTLRGITAGDGKPATLALHRHPFRDRELGDVWLYKFGAPRG